MDEATSKTVAELCREHRHAIDNIRLRCSDARKLDEAQFNDDLFTLRFLLSHKGDEDKAAEAYEATCRWRFQNRELLAGLKAGQPCPHKEIFDRYSISGMHKSTKDGHPIFIVRYGISNLQRLADDVEESKLNEHFLFNKELPYLICDAETRKRGKIVKLISVVDMKHAGFSSDTRIFSVMGKSSKDTELYYPQLLGMSVVVNPPFWARFVMSVARLFLSQATLDKLKMCSGKTLKQPIADCPYASSAIAPEDLPTFLGGKCTCEGRGCILGVSNDETQQHMKYETEEETED